ncbi:MAG: hypothetical protein O3C35_01670 [Proteobacteria bacterium]|nr:hypothetical protein [Pseudomonadota bacterium]
MGKINKSDENRFFVKSYFTSMLVKAGSGNKKAGETLGALVILYFFYQMFLLFFWLPLVLIFWEIPRLIYILIVNYIIPFIKKVIEEGDLKK